MTSTITNRRSYTFDAALEMKDAGLVAASAAATVDGAAKIVPVGSEVFEGVLVIDVSAIEIASNDEHYRIHIEGSTSATFASAIEDLGCLDLGATEVRDGAAQDSVVGRYEIPFVNVQVNTVFPYLRVYTFVGGTIATGINYTAFISKKL
jgi:hypothetical protein